jgi:arsenate reductase
MQAALTLYMTLNQTNHLMNILFLCTGNSCRSVLSEGTFNHLAPEGWQAISAGSQPTGTLHPRAVALLHRKGISTEGYYSKSWDDLPVTPDIVVTVCGTDEQIEAAFERTYAIILARTRAFLALPLEELQADRNRFKTELDRIGTLLP